MKNTYVILPGLNEEKHIHHVVAEVKKQKIKNVVYVDDGSKDTSVQKALNAGATVLKHEINMGKGAAAKTGCDYAIKQGAKIIILMDSDGQHEAKDIKKFLTAIKNKDIVFGYREFNKNMPFTMRFGNHFLTQTSKTLFKMSLKDTQSGYRCFTNTTYKKIRWHSRDYTMESEMIAHASKHKIKYAEVPISTIYHDKHKGTTPIDGIKIFLNMLRFKLLN